MNSLRQEKMNLTKKEQDIYIPRNREELKTDTKCGESSEVRSE